MAYGHVNGAVPAFNKIYIANNIAQKKVGEMVSPYSPPFFCVQLCDILNNRGDTLPTADTERGSAILEMIAP